MLCRPTWLDEDGSLTLWWFQFEVSPALLTFTFDALRRERIRVAGPDNSTSLVRTTLDGICSWIRSACLQITQNLGINMRAHVVKEQKRIQTQMMKGYAVGSKERM